jgi:hypothetical protein
MKPLFLLVLMCNAIWAAPALAEAKNAVTQTAPTNFWKRIKSGPDIHGYFEGRSPCQEIIRLLNGQAREACIKIKWQLLLYRDPVTHAPTRFALGGFLWRNPPKTGNWAIVKGTREDPQAIVYQLELDEPHGRLSFMKADDNILFFLGKDRELLVGNERFSYTLNRAVLEE